MWCLDHMLCGLGNMSKGKQKKNNAKKTTRSSDAMPAESRVSESLTVFWALTVMMALVMNVLCIGAHYYLAANPAAEKMQLFQGMLLFTGCLVGGISLILLPVLYRIRQVPPPPGLAVFGACVAAAPILTVCFQAIR